MKLLAEVQRLGIVHAAGAPHFVKDLASVSAGQAKTIIVLNPDKAVVGSLRPACSLSTYSLPIITVCLPTHLLSQLSKLSRS